MCGVIGIYSRGNHVSQTLYDGMIMLQHRGQDSAGIISCELSKACEQDRKRNRLHRHRGRGLVREVFNEEIMHRLTGNAGIGHVRYPTAGRYNEREVQPFYLNSPYGIAMAHNGNLLNNEKLLKESFDHNKRNIYTDCDSEVLLNIFAHGLSAKRGVMLGYKDVFAAVEHVHQRCQGAYAVVALLAGIGLLAFRDPHAIRPLILGQRETDQGKEYMVASESVALDLFSYQIVGDLEPGEAVFVDYLGHLYRQNCTPREYRAQAQRRSCIFEYVYFSRPDSIIDQVYVNKARMRMGSALAKQVKTEWGEHDVDVVIPVPDTSRTAALKIASGLRTKYREGFIKNRYIGRTFIMAGQGRRDRSVRYKLNPLSAEFKNKNVLLVDDSIVRGTTSRQIVQMAREAGAKKVYFASASPAIRYPNVYGIDMRSYDELIAHNKTTQQVCDAIGADRLIYQHLDELITAVKYGNRKLKQFDCSMFDGHYCPEHTVDERYFSYLYEARDAKRSLGKF